MSVMSGGIPQGYRVERTDTRVMSMGRFFLRFRAESRAREHRPTIPSYHLRVEKVGFARWEIVAYQNRLVRL